MAIAKRKPTGAARSARKKTTQLKKKTAAKQVTKKAAAAKPSRLVIAERRFLYKGKRVWLKVYEPQKRGQDFFCRVEFAGKRFGGSYGVDRLQALMLALFGAEVMLNKIRDELRTIYDDDSMGAPGNIGFPLTLLGARDLPPGDTKRIEKLYDTLHFRELKRPKIKQRFPCHSTTYAPGFSDAAWNDIKVGQKSERVIAKLGHPLEIQAEGKQGSEWWCYSQQQFPDFFYEVRSILISNGVVKSKKHAFLD